MDGNSLNTYLVLIRSHKFFELIARRSVCYFRQGYRGFLVTTEVPPPAKLTIVRRMSGNASKDPNVLAWCQTNLLKESRQFTDGTKETRERTIVLWQRSVELVATAHKAEEEARLELARAHRGQPVTIDGKVFYPTTCVTKDGYETIQFFENDHQPKLDTV
jgi:hypothetical protein